MQNLHKKLLLTTKTLTNAIGSSNVTIDEVYS